MTINWSTWDESIVKDIHGDVWFYRDLYEGNHAKIFPRAKDLIDKGEIIEILAQGKSKALNVQTPYIIANVSKLIPEIPAMLVSRSIGKVKSSITSTDEQNEAASEETDEIIEEADGAANEKIDNLQEELIKQISKNSKLQFEHWTNIVQQQVDGGIVGVPWNDERGLRIDFKSRDVYFPHEDELGVDLAYYRKINDLEYLHVYRERVEDGSLSTNHYLYELQGTTLELLEEDEAKEILGLDSLSDVYEGRSRPFVVYWPNEKTFNKPLGRSCLRNQESKQDEINWTITRSGITFERNGKPRIAVSKDTMDTLKQIAYERYGDENKIDHRDLEITEIDQDGNTIQVIQVDVTKIGDMPWVKDLIKLMLMETKTSEKAIDFYLGEGGSSSAQSGIAKFYDLFISISKAEQIQAEYIYFLQQLFENCLWLANLDDPAIIIEEPEITLNSMLPISKKELMEENNAAYTDGTQSLETTVRRNNPHASEEWIEEELARIEEGKTNDDSVSLFAGRSTLQNFNDNRNPDGTVIKDEENKVGETNDDEPEE